VPMNIMMTSVNLLTSRLMFTDLPESKRMSSISMLVGITMQEFGNIESPMYPRLRHFFSTIYTRF
jgi:hypothetical protein